MSEQEQRVSNGDAPVSNTPEEPSEVAVPEGQEVSEEPFEGAGFEGTQESTPQESTQTEDAEAEWVPGYAQMRAPLDRVLSDPNIALTAPDTTRLPDIAEASFGPLRPGMNPVGDSVVETPLAPEVLIGTDDRIQITDTSSYPWRVHASLAITAADNSLWIGTGWFIGPHTLATAGHVVFIYAPGTPRHGWVRSIQVMPGRNGSSLPYGSVASTDFRSVSGWTGSGEENYDYGAIRIPTELGNTVGWFGFGVYSDSDLLGTTVNISGYPGDKPAGTQWYQARRVTLVNPTSKVYYDIDTAGGQSGSAMYRMIGGGRYGVAFPTYGGATANSGMRIVRPVYDNYVAWKP